MLTQISRSALLAVTGWSTNDLDNHVHHGQLALAFGCTLPAATGAYLGVDCFSLRLFDALMKAGFSRSLSAGFVRDYEKWWPSLERIEWPEMFPREAPSPWAPTPSGLDAGMPPEVHWDAEIYFAVARTKDGGFQVECGTFADIIPAFLRPIGAAPDRVPPLITSVHLRGVYQDTLTAADAVGVALGVPFTRPKGHPEHIFLREQIAVHQAFAFSRLGSRIPPGPKPGRKTLKRRAVANA
jgi:hypothetical protein